MIVDFHGFQAYAWHQPLPKAGVYVFTNTVNGKKYVGISKNLKHRVQSHRNHGTSKTKFARALQKYGIAKFLVEPVYYCVKTWCPVDLLLIESSLIKQLNTAKAGYNCVEESGNGVSYGPEFGQIIRETGWLKTARKTPEFREKLRASLILASAKPAVRSARGSGVRKAFARPEMREKHSITLREAYARPGGKDKLVAAFATKQCKDKRRARWVGSVWANDGTKNVRLKPGEDIPDGFQPGKLAPSIVKGTRCITNGTINRHVRPDDLLPDGFTYGMTRFKRKIAA